MSEITGEAQVMDFISTSEGPRGCLATEFGATLDLLNFVFRTSRGAVPSMGGNYPHMYCHANMENMRIIKVDRRVVSHVGIFPAEIAVGETVLKIGGIGGVGTHPDHRRQGYAGRLLMDSVAKMDAEGYDLSILWAGLSDYYRKFGWEYGGSERHYFLDRGNIELFPSLEGCTVELGPKDQDRCRQMDQLYNRKPLRVIRDEDLSRTLLGIPKHTPYLALQGGQALAYIVLKGDRVVEYGGDPERIMGLVRYILKEQPEVRSISIATPPVSDDLTQLLDERGIPKQTRYLGMLRVICLESLLRKLGLHEMAVHEHEDRIHLSWKGTHASFTRRALVKLLFGPERISTFAQDRLPIPIYWWGTAHM